MTVSCRSEYGEYGRVRYLTSPLSMSISDSGAVIEPTLLAQELLKHYDGTRSIGHRNATQHDKAVAVRRDGVWGVRFLYASIHLWREGKQSAWRRRLGHFARPNRYGHHLTILDEEQLAALGVPQR